VHTTITLLDNYDSFTLNLKHLLQVVTGQAVEVVACADASSDLILQCPFLVISPGPGHPDDYPLYGVLRERTGPVLGVCLGMQILNTVMGGRVEPLAGCCHGKTDTVRFQDRDRVVARYHSLWCSEVADELDVLAVNRQGVPMILRHRSSPFLGYQFHPESFLTEEPEFWIRHAMESVGRVDRPGH
jgi:para-aminobenzoate synthetase component 2